MSIKSETNFKEHDGMLFKMLEEPVLLTPDAELPCLTRLIQDDSRMGMFNRDTKPSRLSDFYLVARIANNNIIVDEFMESDYHRFEIIGYQVEEGSAEWALWFMMQTRRHELVGMVDGVLVHIQNVTYGIGLYQPDKLLPFDFLTNEQFLERANPTGWYVYKPETDKETIAACDKCKHQCTNSNIDHCHMYEPKPESENIIHGHIPPDMRLKYIDLGIYKVGDWVEWCGDQYMIESAPPQSGGRYDIRSPYDELGCSVCPESITRKLSPSEVVIHIGCLSGTVRPVSTNGIHIWFHLIGVDDKTIATIRISCLDTPTRELVESLLEAMRGES